MTDIQPKNEFFLHTYKRLPLDIHHGEGMYLYASNGTKYLDMFSGVAVNLLGHRHPRLLNAIREQSEKYIHLSNYFAQEPQQQLAELVLQQTGMRRLFFCNSGTEAVEGALKIVRKWGLQNNRNTILSFSNAFHGRTLGALSLMDRPKYRTDFEPLLTGFTSLPFNDATALVNAVNGHTAAIVLEPVQGEGGIRPISSDFAALISSLKKNHGFLLIADEIQSGIGRTGKFLALEHFNLSADIVLLAKPLGGGLPLGAILCSESVAGVLEPGNHGSTFGGNPIACAAGTALLQEIAEKKLLQHVAAIGEMFKKQLLSLQSEYPTKIKEIRALGLMVGVELYSDVEPVVQALRENFVLANGTDQTVLRFLPPFIVEEEQINITIEALRLVLSEMAQN